MELFVVCIASFAAGLVVMFLLFRAELHRIAKFLGNRRTLSNSRITNEIPNRGLAELAHVVNEQLDDVQKERRAREAQQREFNRQLSSLSHDVRTPLMGAQGYLQLALKEPDPDVRTEYLHGVRSRIDDTRHMLNQLFDYIKTTDPDTEYRREPTRLLPLLTNVLLGYYPDFEARGWQPQVEFENERFAAVCDRAAATRIIDNLVFNALVHGMAAPTIVQHGRVIAFANKVENPEAIDAAHVFERFYQADSARSGGGSGLGLAVVANLSKAMGIRASAAVEDDEFVIRLEFPEDAGHERMRA